MVNHDKTNTLHSWCNQLWYGESVLAKLLLPLSAMFWLAQIIRKKFQQSKQQKFRAPTIVVGNITVGGTGKTPMVIYLVEMLTKQGLRVGVASRGYGGSLHKTSNKPIRVKKNHLPKEVGDEPWLMYLRLDVPIVIGANRVEVIAELIDKYSCNVVICDDGLQDYRFMHDVEICMVDGQRVYGNQHLLPAGPLREPIRRILACDFAVVNSKIIPAISADHMQVYCDRAIDVNDAANTKSLAEFSQQTVHAVAGIGNPNRFFELLKTAGISIIEHVFPDHALYNKSDLEFDDTKPILMTEKDAVKCFGMSIKNCWYLPIYAKLPENFITRVQSKLSERHG